MFTTGGGCFAVGGEGYCSKTARIQMSLIFFISLKQLYTLRCKCSLERRHSDQQRLLGPYYATALGWASVEPKVKQFLGVFYATCEILVRLHGSFDSCCASKNEQRV